MGLKGKTALVTGSTSGIGLGIAHALAGEGADIMMNGFAEASEIEALQSEIRQKFAVKVGFAPGDISKPDQAAAMVAQAQSEMGGVDILVNNAGVQFVADIVDFPDSQWDRVIAINLSGAFYMMKAAIPGMKAKGWGRIVNIASAHGLVGSAQKVAYVAAKHGLLGATKVAAIELANTGITCNAICPGWVLTPLVQKQLEDAAAKSGKDLETTKAEFLAAKQPMRQFSTPEEIGAAAVYLCSEGARTVTGIPLSVDGGWVIE